MNLARLVAIVRTNSVPFIALGPEDWDCVRDEVVEEGEFYADPNLNAQHFLVLGVPIMRGGCC